MDERAQWIQLHSEAREVLSEKTWAEMEECELFSQLKSGMKSFPGLVNNMCKGPEAETGLVHSNGIEEAKHEVRHGPEAR